MELRNLLYTSLTHILIALTVFTSGAQISTTKPLYRSKSEPTVRIKCLTGVMLISIKDAPVSHESGSFSGMIYPKGLSKNSTCLSEYRDHTGTLKYKLPLRSCNTMPQETEDGGIEFFNTIVLQPHLKLVTDMGRGYHVRCRYKSREAAATSSPSSNSKRKLSPQPYKSDDGDEEASKQELSKETEESNHNQASDRRDYGRSLGKLSSSNNGSEDDEENSSNALVDLTDDVPMPGCHMKIFNEDEKIAENVKIGDSLTLVINIDKQDIYGLHVTDCIVRDGLGWGEQKLVGDDGCPMDNEIMGPFVYNNDRLSANVTFPAHKFPYTASVYYQCNVRLCALQDPDCQKAPMCGDNVKRPKRQSSGVKEDDGLPATIEVYSGLYVNENNDSSESDDDDSVFRERTEDAICVSQRTFAIAIAIAGLILMLAVVAAVLCIMARRRTKTVSHSGSSIYSGPYTNTAFSHSS